MVIVMMRGLVPLDRISYVLDTSFSSAPFSSSVILRFQHFRAESDLMEYTDSVLHSLFSTVQKNSVL